MNSDERRGLPTEVLSRIVAHYGLAVVSWGPVEGGYRNASYSFTTVEGRTLNFILYKHEPGIVALIRRTNDLGEYVARKGIPVRTPADPRILRVGARYGSLYAYLPGETISWEAYTMKHIKLLGFGLARFHAAAADFSGELPSVEGIYRDIYTKMARYFSDPNVAGAMIEKLNVRVALPDFTFLLDSAQKLPGRTALHMDFVRGNVLFRPSKPGDVLSIETVTLSGILDLEKAAYGHPVFDVARTLAFLLVDCPKPAEKVYKYFLESGYRKRGGGMLDDAIFPSGTFSGSLGANGQFVLSHSAGKAEPSKAPEVQIATPQMLEQLITLFLIYDFYKFLRQNPYESLAENHHFTRTVAILRDRKVLQ